MARKSALKQAEEKRQQAEHSLATVQALAEARVMEHSLALLESPQPVVTPWQEYPQYDDFSRWPTVANGGMPWTTLEDRTEERYRPIYEGPTDLRMIRASARRLKAMFAVARGAIEALTNYVIGPGFEFEIQPAAAGYDQLAVKAQGVVDRFLDRNDFIGRMDREIHANSREDGEQLIVLYWDGADRKDIRIELIDPDYLLQPADPRPLERMLGTQHKLNAWWHGVHTVYDASLKRDDVTRPRGYHVVFDRTGEQWDYLPACRAELIKRNVGSTARRGISDLYVIQRELELEGKIRRNTAEGAAILAAIVMIREHAEGVSKSSVQSLVGTNATGSYSKPVENGSRTTYSEQVRPGTIKDTPHGMKTMVGPLGTLNQPIYIQVAQYLLRIIGTAWNMPEALISGDASNANLASSLVAEAPFVRAREADQAFYANHFESLIWKALRMSHEGGAFGGIKWQQIRQGLTLKVDYPSPASRDKAEQAATNKILNDSGVMSKRTWATDMGLDYDEEERELLAEPKPAVLPQLDPFGGQPIRESEEKWVTINGNAVQIDGEGNVLTGPLKGKSLRIKTSADKHISADAIEPINDVRNKTFFAKLVANMQKHGYKGKPVVAIDMGDGIYKAVTGSHRILAAREADVKLPVVIIPARFKDDIYGDDDMKATQLANLSRTHHELKKANRLMQQELSDDPFEADTHPESMDYSLAVRAMQRLMEGSHADA